ncbi:50S ribosomal protein L11 methyltransferase [Bartonella tamiae]|uniref:Ribosomal protein L11 methyltransferase n=1 Tax=Bartonella tamiae Th239 TaxID=1094558 RepID=J0QT48_9HYPH|nr:50S ribosomal protein L11 methyltransferase [Bartonella tamiae]EJF89051.1 ribosomal protein L11 methyltransferase [Bartonella tamiae Th239]EJF94699.1 ribosomal protein L11 methyltransferase [Bartonella tamiae Th307]
MGQLRLYHRAPKIEAEHAYQAMEIAFENDGLPLAITVIDEHEALYEVSLYLDAEIKETVLDQLSKLLNISIDKIEVEEIPDIDWVSHSLEGLQPVRAGVFFVHGSHDRDKITPDDLAIEIEAGQAFGTGHHGTTAGCLEMITKVMKTENPQNALDLGTGSGVLAIAIALLKPISILATDNDAIAIQVAEDNFKLNGVDKAITAITAAGFSHEKIVAHAPFDLIVANILANPLIELASDLMAAHKKGGSIILSGILEEQHDRVLQAYLDQGARHKETLHREGWVTIHLV